jgi:agmatinase
LHADVFSETLFQEIKKQKIKKMYISIDIDVLDASAAPGTGVPEPGGMSTRYLIDIIQHLGDFIAKEQNMDLVALDLVEVAPDWDIGNVTALAAVKILFETLGAYFIAEKTKEKTSSHPS